MYFISVEAAGTKKPMGADLRALEEEGDTKKKQQPNTFPSKPGTLLPLPRWNWGKKDHVCLQGGNERRNDKTSSSLGIPEDWAVGRLQQKKHPPELHSEISPERSTFLGDNVSVVAAVALGRVC